MENITNLYKNCKDIEILIKKRTKRLIRIETIKSELNTLYTKKQDIQNDINKTTRYEDDLKKLETEIKKLTIINKKITDLNDFDEIDDQDILLTKCKIYIDELLYEWQENDKKIIVLNKNIKPFFVKMKDKENVYAECKTFMYNKLKNLMEDFIFTNVVFEIFEKEIYLSKGYENGSLDLFYKGNKELCNFVFNILCNNVENHVKMAIEDRDEEYKEFYIENNEILRNTKFFVIDVDKKLDGFVLEVLDQLVSKRRENIKIDKEIREHNFSEDFVTLLFCIKKLGIRRNDMDLEDVLGRFFDIDKIEKGVFNYLCIFSEVCYSIKEFKNLQILMPIKDRLFDLIIVNSGVNNVTFINPLENLKMELWQNYHAFKEILEFFNTNKTRLIFISNYFDKLCDHFILFVLNKKSISIQESEMYIEIIEYIFEISGVEKSLSNFCRMKCIEFILGSNLKEIEENFDDGKYCLEDDEVLKLVMALFNGSEKRTKLVNKIRGN